MVKDGEFSQNLFIVSLFFPAEVVQTFGYQCRNSEELNRMWETCKVSIGKRCQNTRNKNRQA